MNNYFKRLKQLTESLLEDYLELDDMLVEIGVLTYLSQAGKLNDSKENQLRKYIEEATEQISFKLTDWLFEHGLVELAEALGGDYSEYQESEDISGLENLLEKLREAVLEDWYSPDLMEYINGEGRYRFAFGILNTSIFKHMEDDELRDLLEPYITEEEDEEGNINRFLDLDEEGLSDILINFRGEQAKENEEFYNLAKNNVEAVELVKEGQDYDDIKTLVLKFDRLKDMVHHGGNFLHDKLDIDFNKVNQVVEERVKGMARK